MLRILLILALLLSTPAIGLAQTVRISDGVDSVQVTTTGGGSLQVECLAGCATASDVTGTPVTFNDVNDVASVAITGRNGVNVTIAAGSLDAILTAQISTNNGVSWELASFGDPATGLATRNLTVSAPGTDVNRVILFPGAFTHARVIVDTFNAGSAEVTLRSTTVNTVVAAYGADVAGTGMQPLTFKNSAPAGTEMAALFRCVSGCSGSGGTSKQSNTAWTYGTDNLTPGGWLFDDTPVAPTDGNIDVARMTANRYIPVEVMLPNGTPATSNTTGVLVSLSTVASTQGYNRRANATVTGAGVVTSVSTEGTGALMFQLVTTSTNYTLVFEGEVDASTYERVPFILTGGTTTAVSGTNHRKMGSKLTNTSGTQRGWVLAAGYRSIRANVTAKTGAENLAVHLEQSIAPSGINPLGVYCSETATFNSNAATTPVQLIAGATDERIFICGIDVSSDGTTTFKLIEGNTGTCGSPADLTGTHRLTAQVGWTRDASLGSVLYKSATAGNNICFTTGGSVQVDGTVSYARY